jgi:hypothetical protein
VTLLSIGRCHLPLQRKKNNHARTLRFPPPLVFLSPLSPSNVFPLSLSPSPPLSRVRGGGGGKKPLAILRTLPNKTRTQSCTTHLESEQRAPSPFKGIPTRQQHLTDMRITARMQNQGPTRRVLKPRVPTPASHRSSHQALEDLPSLP